MFEYFPQNYPWSLATTMVFNSGGSMSELNDVLAPLKDRTFADEAQANHAFSAAWVALGDKLRWQALEDEGRGNALGAGRKFRKASLYYFTAERVFTPSDPDRMPCYDRMLETFSRFLALRREPASRVQIPFGATHLPALWVPARGAEPAPCMVHFMGLDVCKEFVYFTGFVHELALRGISSLLVDHPGVGEALRKHGLTYVAESERAAGAAVDWLERRPEVLADRIGIVAPSLGGYNAPRAAAFEKRLACCVAWGAVHDFGKRLRERMAAGRLEYRSVPHFIEHLLWAFGAGSMDEVLAIADRMTLDGVAEKITCPLLIVHGENDRQVPLSQAQRTYEQAVNAPVRELKVHTIAEGGSEHCSGDNFDPTFDYMAHWIQCQLAGGRT